MPHAGNHRRSINTKVLTTAKNYDETSDQKNSKTFFKDILDRKLSIQFSFIKRVFRDPGSFCFWERRVTISKRNTGEFRD